MAILNLLENNLKFQNKVIVLNKMKFDDLSTIVDDSTVYAIMGEIKWRQHANENLLGTIIPEEVQILL